MTTMRFWLVNGLIVLIIGGSLFDIVTDREHWPFSAYPMFSSINKERSFEGLAVYGIPEGGGPDTEELPLWAPQYRYPFDLARLADSLEVMDRLPARAEFLERALSDFLQRYEARRQAGHHDGPPLQGARLYRVFWQLDPQAQNADRPDRKDLLFEVKSAPAGGVSR